MSAASGWRLQMLNSVDSIASNMGLGGPSREQMFQAGFHPDDFRDDLNASKWSIVETMFQNHSTGDLVRMGYGIDRFDPADQEMLTGALLHLGKRLSHNADSLQEITRMSRDADLWRKKHPLVRAVRTIARWLGL